MAWSTRIRDAARGYPRPQLVRNEWFSLNGPWDFAIDADGRWDEPGDVRWNRRIQVPFAPETTASGVGVRDFFRACWYRRTFAAPAVPDGHRLILHFGAVDYHATVWVNRSVVCRHEGGYTPFQADITRFVGPGGRCEVIVHVEDDPADLAKPRGKQDWQRDPHSIWYHRTTGIWQTVWMERVPPAWIGRVRWTANLERWEIGVNVRVDGRWPEPLQLRVRLHSKGNTLADDSYAVLGQEVHRRVALSDPGIDDYRNELLWNPSSPTLINAELRLLSPRGVVDEVASYAAIRSVEVEGDRFVLNGRPYQMRLVLDQGYWPETGLTAPDDAALRRDVELARAMGFNGVRKHQKIEDPRYLYWADRIGLLVWGEMPSAYRFTRRSVQRLTREWIAALERDYSHPSIVAWVPFNESWGVPNLPKNPAERHYVQALYHLTKTLDPTRPVIGNDGWESVSTDIIGIHDYDPDPVRIAKRYHAEEILPRLFKRERPGGRLLVLGSEKLPDQPIVLTEFGGITYSPDAHGTWGYSRAPTPEALAERYESLMSVMHSLGVFAGFCYTQFADTYQEANGLLYADRTPKFSIDRLRRATSGSDAPVEHQQRDVGSHPLPHAPDDVELVEPAEQDEPR
jgi:beta-galactosidase/beta-glucuronidase